ncbi:MULTISPECIES: hypothetical protein [Methylobacterium]|uniref:hypothetical protein n=1 Tax=Methylobacterium TaxID=407 RepID=UPI0013EB233D|nr:hypothetical protein [Methylobacterium sp. DB0501]NGM33024.1 hypothetical protein [Methylobacterium sp. DB0501]
MRAAALLLAALLLAALLAPHPASANGSDCGGDAYSSATIGANPPGPLTAIPDTLCADLDQGRAPEARIEVIAPGYGAPGYSSPGYGSPGLPPYGATGDRYAPAPYGGRPLLGPRPRGGRDPER